MLEYVGLDVSKEETAYCVKDSVGKVLAHGRAVQRSLHEFVFGEVIEAAQGVSVAGVGHVFDLVGA